MSDIRNAKVDLITTREINLKGRKHSNSADAVDSQDLVTLSQLKAVSESIPAVPSPYKLPADVVKYDKEQKFTASQEITPTDATKPALIIHEFTGGQLGSIFVVQDSTGSVILSIKGAGATPVRNDTVLNGPITIGNVMPTGDNLYVVGTPAKTWKQIDGYIIEALTYFQTNGSPGISGTVNYVKQTTPTLLTGTLTFKGGILTGAT